MADRIPSGDQGLESAGRRGDTSSWARLPRGSPGVSGIQGPWEIHFFITGPPQAGASRR